MFSLLLDLLMWKGSCYIKWLHAILLLELDLAQSESLTTH